MACKNRVAVGGVAAVVGLASALFAQAGPSLTTDCDTPAIQAQSRGSTRLWWLRVSDRSQRHSAAPRHDFTRVLVGANAAEHVSTYRPRLASRLGEPAAEYGTGVLCDVFEQRVSNGWWPTIEDVAGAMAGNAVDAQIIDQVVGAAVENAVATQLGATQNFKSRRPRSAISCPEWRLRGRFGAPLFLHQP